jgi:sulfur carrier protein
MAEQRIQVRINLISTELTVPAVLSDAIEAAGVKPPFAAAVNMQFVPKKNYTSHSLQAGDNVELIVPVTGG